MYRGTAEKLLFSVLMIAVVPLYCALCVLMPEAYVFDLPVYRVVFTMLFYGGLAFLCAWYLRNKAVIRKDALWALAIGAVTLAYCIPFRLWVIVPAVATGLVFLVCRDLARTEYKGFTWVSHSPLRNMAVWGCITLLCLALHLSTYRGRFVFSWQNVAGALAAGISEELIFRVLFPLLIYKYFDVVDSFGDKAWIFIITTVLFWLVHCVSPITAWNLSAILGMGWTMVFTSGVSAFLIYKYGFAYGVYFHVLWDVIAFSV